MGATCGKQGATFLTETSTRFCRYNYLVVFTAPGGVSVKRCRALLLAAIIFSCYAGQIGFLDKLKGRFSRLPVWSGKRDSNSRLLPWQGNALPLSHSRGNRLLRLLLVGDVGLEPTTACL